MSNVTIEMDVYTAAAVRQALFREQDGYTYDETCVPERIVNIRKVIADVDAGIESVVKSEKENLETESE
jgi:hypothetical protein